MEIFMVIRITGNYIADCSIFSFIIAQALKFIFYWVRQKRRPNLRYIFTSGGMPSSHAATVVSLATAVYFIEGIASTYFAISLILALIVMYDAAGVRRAVGQQAGILNYMMENWKDTSPNMFDKKLKELLGHTPIEVFAGAVLGAAIAMIYPM